MLRLPLDGMDHPLPLGRWGPVEFSSNQGFCHVYLS